MSDTNDLDNNNAETQQKSASPAHSNVCVSMVLRFLSSLTSIFVLEISIIISITFNSISDWRFIWFRRSNDY